MSESIPSLRQIAAAAGVHYSTVSLALRKHPSIPAGTRERIHGIAMKLGYRRDPMLSALAQYRHRKAGPFNPSVLAFLAPQRGSSQSWKSHHIGRGYYEGAQIRARELGFSTETFSYHRAEMTPARLAGILEARNIHALLLFPTIPSRGHLRLPWERYSAVALGYSLVYPPIHRVTTAHTQLVMTLIRELRAAGYRRFGLVVRPEHDERVNHGWSAGYLLEQQRLSKAARIPILGELEPKTLIHWVKRWNPDVVISLYGQPLQWLRDSGFRIPEEIGFACLSLTESMRHEQICGMDEGAYAVGEAAVDSLVALIQRLERGVPKRRTTLLIEGQFYAGKTIHLWREPAEG